jgi:hypothetical protein
MKRRELLKNAGAMAGTAVVGAVAASSLLKPAISQGLLELRWSRRGRRTFLAWELAPNGLRSAFKELQRPNFNQGICSRRTRTAI